MTTLNPFDVAQKPAGHPAQIITGSFASWWLDATFSDTSFGLKYIFRSTSGSPSIEVVGAYVDGRWTFTVPGATSDAWSPGRWSFDLALVRTLDGEVGVLESGWVQFIDPASDRRSKAEVMVDKIDSILAGRADDDVDSYTINSRSLTKMSVKDLMQWRAHYLSEVARERNGGRIPRLMVRFTG